MPLVTAKEHILNQVKRLAQNRWIRYSVQAIIIIWWLYFLYSTFSGATESLKNLRLDVSALSLALLLSIMSTLLGAPFWWLILLGLGHSSKLSVSGRIHLIPGLTKYLPGFGWDYLSKASLSKEFGIPKKTIGLGLLIELFQLVSMGCMISVLLFPLGLAEQIRGIAISTIGRADWRAGDLKHLIASLLPAPLYRNLVDFITHRRSARIEGEQS